MVTAHPDRFAAFATPPVTVPAAAELLRAVGELGFAGTMISDTLSLQNQAQREPRDRAFHRFAGSDDGVQR